MRVQPTHISVRPATGTMDVRAGSRQPDSSGVPLIFATIHSHQANYQCKLILCFSISGLEKTFVDRKIREDFLPRKFRAIIMYRQN